jgi:hypothetical protein
VRARQAREDGVPYFRHGIFVEEYLEGPEISFDSACHDGVLMPLFLARKLTGFPPYFEETGHSIDAADPLLPDPELLNVLVSAHRAVGFHDGITHTEVKLTKDGPLGPRRRRRRSKSSARSTSRRNAHPRDRHDAVVCFAA